MSFKFILGRLSFNHWRALNLRAITKIESCIFMLPSWNKDYYDIVIIIKARTINQGLIQQGVWVSFGLPGPWKIPDFRWKDTLDFGMCFL